MLALLAAACSRTRVPEEPFRLGYFPNVTHAQALVGVTEGVFARALGHPIDARVFNAGPDAMQALVSGQLDASYVGPGPAVIAHLRAGGEGFAVVAGAVSGGSALVVREIEAPARLAGKRIGTPQIGNTQDIALRIWLRGQGLSDERSKPMGVEVVAISNPDIPSAFSRGEIDGAWVPQPWAARLVEEAGGKVLVDERALWEGRRFPTALLVVSRRALVRRRPDVVALVRAHVELTRRWRADPAAFAARANAAFARIAGRTLRPAVLRDAFGSMEPILDPLPDALAGIARDAQSLGYAPPGDVSGLVEAGLLAEVAAK